MSMELREGVQRALRHPLLWILVLAAILRWLATGSLRLSDDSVYAQAALDTISGQYDASKGFYYLRLGLVVPTALAFAAVGVSYGATLIWPMTSSLLSLVAAYRLAKEVASEQVALWTALVVAVSTQHVLSGGELFPDSPMVLWGTLTLLFYIRATKPDQTRVSLAYGLSGLCFAIGMITRIDLIKFVPALIVLEVLRWRRSGFDRRMLWWFAAAGMVLLVDWLVLWSLSGNPLIRYTEIERGVYEWETSPAARVHGLTPMLKSLVSPFGAFGLLFIVAVIGVALCLRERRQGGMAAILAIVLAITLWLAFAHRLSEGRMYTLLTPLVAIFAAEALSRIPSPRWVAVLVVTVSVLLVHTRLPVRNVQVLAQAVGRSGAPIITDARTAPALRMFWKADARTVEASASLPRPSWLIRNELALHLDRVLYDREPIKAEGEVVAEWALRPGGVPPFRQIADALLRLRGSGHDPRVTLHRLD